MKCSVCKAAMPALLFMRPHRTKLHPKDLKFFKCDACGSAQTGTIPDSVEHQKLYFQEYWVARKTQYQGRIKNTLTERFLASARQ